MRSYPDTPLPDSAALCAFRNALRQNRYDGMFVSERLREIVRPFSAGSMRHEVIRYIFSDAPKLGILLELFLSDEGIRRIEVREILGDKICDELLRIGVLKKSGINRLKSNFLLFPFRNFYFFTDSFVKNNGVDDSNVVFELNREQEILESCLVSTPCDSFLDLCSGSGVFAILSSRFAEKILGVDINPRAVALARVNAVLNAVPKTVFVQGNLYDAIDGRVFDRIVANPPYNPFLTPAGTPKLCIHSGPSGEDALIAILSGLERHLAEGGICQIVSRFFHRDSVLFSDWIGRFCDSRKFSQLLIHTEPRDIFTLSNLEKTAWSVGEENAHRLYDLYRREGISRESFGVLTLRRTGRPGPAKTITMDFDQWNPAVRLESHVLEQLA